MKKIFLFIFIISLLISTIIFYVYTFNQAINKETHKSFKSKAYENNSMMYAYFSGVDSNNSIGLIKSSQKNVYLHIQTESEYKISYAKIVFVYNSEYINISYNPSDIFSQFELKIFDNYQGKPNLKRITIYGVNTSKSQNLSNILTLPIRIIPIKETPNNEPVKILEFLYTNDLVSYDEEYWSSSVIFHTLTPNNLINSLFNNSNNPNNTYQNKNPYILARILPQINSSATPYPPYSPTIIITPTPTTITNLKTISCSSIALISINPSDLVSIPLPANQEIAILPISFQTPLNITNKYAHILNDSNEIICNNDQTYVQISYSGSQPILSLRAQNQNIAGGCILRANTNYKIKWFIKLEENWVNCIQNFIVE